MDYKEFLLNVFVAPFGLLFATLLFIALVAVPVGIISGVLILMDFYSPWCGLLLVPLLGLFMYTL